MRTFAARRAPRQDRGSARRRLAAVTGLVVPTTSLVGTGTAGGSADDRSDRDQRGNRRGIEVLSSAPQPATGGAAPARGGRGLPATITAVPC